MPKFCWNLISKFPCNVYYSFLTNGFKALNLFIWKYLNSLEIPISKCSVFKYKRFGASLMAQPVKNLPAMKETQETRVQFLSQKNPLEEEMATHSSILAWRIPIDRGAWWANSQWGCKELDMTEWLSTQHTACYWQLFVIKEKQSWNTNLKVK